MFIKSGDSYTCDSAHIIGTALVDMEAGKDDDWVGKINWHQSVPQEGKPAICEICGLMFMFSQTQPTEHPLLFRRHWWVCINGTWRPELSEAARAYLDSFRGFGT